MQDTEERKVEKITRDLRDDAPENSARIAEGNRIEHLRMLRLPFPDNQVGQLPKGTKEQNTCPASEKRNCAVCGGWHHPKIKHLSYVGHAALTDRLLDADLQWTWEPMALTPEGLPKFDASGGLWIRLTVCGVTRIGYGHAKAKGEDYADVGSREKEVIGDALRNAGMRFGTALELWHKGELHAHQEEEGNARLAAYVDKAPTLVPKSDADESTAAGATPEDTAIALLARFDAAKTEADVEAAIEAVKKAWPIIRGVKHITESFAAMRKNARLRIKHAGDVGDITF
jgi:hypothetical protein